VSVNDVVAVGSLVVFVCASSVFMVVLGALVWDWWRFG